MPVFNSVVDEISVAANLMPMSLTSLCEFSRSLWTWVHRHELVDLSSSMWVRRCEFAAVSSPLWDRDRRRKFVAVSEPPWLRRRELFGPALRGRRRLVEGKFEVVWWPSGITRARPDSKQEAKFLCRLTCYVYYVEVAEDGYDLHWWDMQTVFEEWASLWLN